jgi:hypothetical protein
MGSKEIFIMAGDQHKAKTGHPKFVMTNFVDMSNIACHIIVHPDGSIVWFGSNEDNRQADGKFSSDAYLIMNDQTKLKRVAIPLWKELVTYCHFRASAESMSCLIEMAKAI